MRQLASRGAQSIELSQVAGASGQPSRVQLTVSCGSEQGTADAVAAVILQSTAALDVRVSQDQRCGLPQETVAVATPWGRVRVAISLKGGDVFKASPHWVECERAAAAATAAPGREPVAAEAVAAAALEALEAGLADGSIALGVQHLF